MTKKLMSAAAIAVILTCGAILKTLYVPPWSLHSLASAFGYRDAATDQQAAYARWYCKGKQRNMVAVYVDYGPVIGRDDFAPALEVNCDRRDAKEYSERVYLTAPSDNPFVIPKDPNDAHAAFTASDDTN